MSMNGLVVEIDGLLNVRELPVPEIDDYKALVKMEACGICNGTDLKLIHRSFKNFNSYPAVLGHEGVGRVVKTGAKVTSFKNGDRVLLPFIEEKIGDCYPGFGSFCEFAVVGDINAMTRDGKGCGTDYFSEAYYAQQVVPEFIDSVSATMIVTFREVLSAIKRFGIKENNSIVVYGAGPVGLCFIKFCKLLGLSPVISIDITDAKNEEALRTGADYAFNSTKINIVEAVRGILPGGVDFSVDAVGNNGIINQSMEIIKYNGQICCYGISPKLGMDLDWSKAPYNWSINFIQWPLKLEEAQAHSQIINWIESGVLNPMDYVSDVFDFKEIIPAFKMVEEKGSLKKVVIKYY